MVSAVAVKSAPDVVEAFDYSTVDKATASEARALVNRVRSLERRLTEEALQIGAAMIRMKERLDHGSFGPWLAAEFGPKVVRTIQRWMEMAAALDGKTDKLSYLPPSTLHALVTAATPVAAREKIMAMIEAGERPTSPEVMHSVRTAQAEARQQAKLDKLSPEERKRRAAKAKRETTTAEKHKAEWDARQRREQEERLADLDRAASAAELILDGLGERAGDLLPLLGSRGDDALSRELRERLGHVEPRRAPHDRMRWRLREIIAGRLKLPPYTFTDSADWQEDGFPHASTPAGP